MSPVHKVDGAVDGVDDPGGCGSQLHPLTRRHRLLPDEAAGQRADGSVTSCTLLSNQEPVSGKPVVWVAPPDGRDEDLLHLLVSFRHQVGRRTLQLHVFLLLERRQHYLTHIGQDHIRTSAVEFSMSLR